MDIKTVPRIYQFNGLLTAVILASIFYCVCTLGSYYMSLEALCNHPGSRRDDRCDTLLWRGIFTPKNGANFLEQGRTVFPRRILWKRSFFNLVFAPLLWLLASPKLRRSNPHPDGEEEVPPRLQNTTAHVAHGASRVFNKQHDVIAGAPCWPDGLWF